MSLKILIRTGAIAATTLLATLAVASTASAQSTIRVGQTVNGTLSASDPVMEVDGSNYDCYIVSTRAGQTYTIDLESDDFDTFIGMGAGRGCQPPIDDYNDDSDDGGTNSRLTFTSAGGDYFIFANSYEAGETGAYRLTVSEVGRSAPPPSAQTDLTLTRPSDPDERYMFDITCWLVASRAIPELVTDGMSRQAYAQLEIDNLEFYTNAEASGAALGKSAEQVGQDVTLYDERLTNAPELLNDIPLIGTRNACLAAIGR
ncbi:MAG: hypothetical protein KKF88_02510 [Alphaproteobacteria bacterium]|nr:hypothetical protein [Alphaproteobacteria bacterium]